MTVIAFDFKYLVADGRMCRGTSLVSDTVTKLHKQSVSGLGDCIIGLCGCMDLKGPYLEHLNAEGLTPMDTFLGKDEDGPIAMRGFVYDISGKECYEISSEGGYFLLDSPQAIGSGCFTAQHYLTTGHNAIVAVVEACKTEMTCGGDILIYDIEKGEFITSSKGEEA